MTALEKNLMCLCLGVDKKSDKKNYYFPPFNCRQENEVEKPIWNDLIKRGYAVFENGLYQVTLKGLQTLDHYVDFRLYNPEAKYDDTLQECVFKAFCEFDFAPVKPIATSSIIRKYCLPESKTRTAVAKLVEAGLIRKVYTSDYHAEHSMFTEGFRVTAKGKSTDTYKTAERTYGKNRHS